MTFLNKCLLFLAIVAFVGGASLWILGGKKNQYAASLEIDSLPHQIFPYLTQPDRLKQWIDGLEDVGRYTPQIETELPTPPKKTKRVMKIAGKNTRFDDQVIRYRDGKLLSVQSSNENMILTSIFQIERQPTGKSIFSYEIKTTNQSLGRFLAPIQKTELQSRVESDVQRLKELVEKNEPKLDPNDFPVETEPSSNQSANALSSGATGTDSNENFGSDASSTDESDESLFESPNFPTTNPGSGIQ